MYYNFLHSLAQIWERGIQSRILKQFTISKEPEEQEQPSTIDVRMVTVTPILVVLAAGYVIGIFVLFIERCAHRNILKCWPRGSVRRWRQNEHWRLLYNYQKYPIQLTAARPDILLTYCCMILLNSIFSSVSMSVIRSVTFGLIKTLCHSALKPTVHTVCETQFRSREKKISNRQVKTEATLKW